MKPRVLRRARAAALGALLLAVLPCAAAAAADWNGSPLVRTRFGLVRGFPDDDGTFVWKAIPYAAPPVGDLRWRAPRDPEPWAGTRAERGFGRPCTQRAPFGAGTRGSEDCLTLNVWRPRDAGRGLPVYVWIHGGGNSIGSSVMVNEYRGTRVAAGSRFVFVSVNYRLGPFGWFTHPALREGASAEDASGNYGTLDIIHALRWVRDNIEAFGGDPGLVAVTGESAGGANVLSLMISPAAEGLFHRAIAQSAAGATRDPADGDRRSRQVLLQLLVNDGKARTLEAAAAVADAMGSRQVRDYLRSKSDRQIMKCYAGSATGMVDNPSLFRDGRVIAAEGLDALATSPTAARVPLLVGSNREELKLFLAFDRSLSWKSDLWAAVARYGSQRWKAAGVDSVARRVSSRAASPPVWAYEFAWGAPDDAGASVMPGNWGRRLGAFHSLEIPFLLGHETLNVALHALVFTKANRQGRLALSGAMRDWAASFVRTGNPNRPGSGLPAWEPWSNAAGAPKCIVLDAGLQGARISMSSRELTDASVFGAIDSELAPGLAGQVREWLTRTRYPSPSR